MDSKQLRLRWGALLPFVAMLASSSCTELLVTAVVLTDPGGKIPAAPPDLWRELQEKQRSTGLAIAAGGSSLEVIWLDRPQHVSTFFNVRGKYYKLLQVDATGTRIIADDESELRIFDTAWRLIHIFPRVAYMSLELSPDGVHLAVVDPSSRSLSILNGVTGGRIPVTPRGLNPSWSPDGSQLVYEELNVDENAPAPQAPDYERMLRIFSLTTRQTRPLATGFHPSWSPDGRWIVYLSAGHVMLADAEAPKKVRRLSSSRNRGAGRWSPDGEYLLYVESLVSVWNDPDQCPAGIMVYRLKDGANGSVHRSCQVTGSGTYRWLLNKDIARAASADGGSLRLR